MKDTIIHNFTVSTWYDRRTRNYITQLKDTNGNQIGDALYDFRPSGARMSRAALVKDADRLVHDHNHPRVPESMAEGASISDPPT